MVGRWVDGETFDSWQLAASILPFRLVAVLANISAALAPIRSGLLALAKNEDQDLVLNSSLDS